MQPTRLTLAAVAADPARATFMDATRAGEQVCLRPLRPDDVDALARFLGGLSPQTRHFSIFPSYDRATARVLCDAINRFDKLRLVVEVIPAQTIVGLIEFSFDIPAGDMARYAAYGVALDARDDCRFGPTFADAYQDQGLGTRLFPYVVAVARGFGKTRIMLWGGVLAENGRAIRFYEKQGFVRMGEFVDGEGLPVIDMLLDLGEYHPQ